MQPQRPHMTKGVAQEGVAPRARRDGGSPDARRDSRQRGATAAGLRGSPPARRLRPSPPPDSRFSAPRSFRKVPPPRSGMPQPTPASPARPRATDTGRFPARRRGNGPTTERREGQATSSAIRNARRGKRLCFFLWRPLVGGGRSIANVASPGNREGRSCKGILATSQNSERWLPGGG